jgi:response regulator RpfG family c-di-GMP phosphodiesterase
MTSLAIDRGQYSPASRPAEAARILVVDDEDTIRLVLAKYLRTRGFDVATAESGDAALEALAQSRFDLMLCDVRMPGLSGIEIVPVAREQNPDLGIVMLTAVNDAPTATEAMAQGVLDYLIKPIELQQLYEAIVRALHKREGLREKRQLEHAIRDEVAARTRQLEKETAQLRDVAVATVQTMVNTMEARDVYQRGHSARVADLAASIAEHLRLAPEVAEDVRVAGRLHDVGNVGVRESVLNKAGPLTAEEYDHVKEHVRLGTEALTPLRHLARIVIYIGDHHERWDGHGYPRGIGGDQISIGGRILAAAEAFDALTSKRAYRDALSPGEALDHLGSQAGKLLDPRVYEALRAVVQK